MTLELCRTTRSCLSAQRESWVDVATTFSCSACCPMRNDCQSMTPIMVTANTTRKASPAATSPWYRARLFSILVMSISGTSTSEEYGHACHERGDAACGGSPDSSFHFQGGDVDPDSD